MTDSSVSVPAPARSLEATAAFCLLRLFLGLRALLAGLEKFELGGTWSFANYYTTMPKMAAGITANSFLPLWATRIFALSLGYLLIVIGIALLLGLKTRIALVANGLLYVGLGFGLMAVQSNDGVAWIGVYVGMTVGALLLVRYNRFALWRDN
jgi:thiosulfate dehydrogenase [quinone] large subunit